tara:strand:- start:76 stop:237 length:162 start_codon:yes stop_codon:yes gene_type:complete
MDEVRLKNLKTLLSWLDEVGNKPSFTGFSDDIKDAIKDLEYFVLDEEELAKDG